jgi:uncharacterized membrane protein YhfC
MFSLKGIDASALPASLDGSTKARIVAQAQYYWGMPPYLPLLGGLERLFAMCFHVAMALLVLAAVTRRRLDLLLLAMVLHASVNAVAVMVSQWCGPEATEAVLALFAAACVWMSIRVRSRWAA